MITSLQVEVSGATLRTLKLWKIANQDHTRQSPWQWKETKRSRNEGNQKNRKHYQASAEAGCQEEVKKTNEK